MGGDPAAASQGNLDAASWGKETVRAVRRRRQFGRNVHNDPGTVPRSDDVGRHSGRCRKGEDGTNPQLSAKNEEGARTMRTPSSERKLNAIQQRSLQPQQQQLLQQPLPLRLLQQQQQPQPLQQP